MLMRISRAWHIRPNLIRAWDYWEEYAPALMQLSKIPLVDEFVCAVFKGKNGSGKSSLPTSPSPKATKSERLAIFNDLKNKAESLKNGTKNKDNN